MTIEEIKELIQVLRDTGIAELEVQRGDNRVRIRGSFAGALEPATTTVTVPMPASPLPSSTGGPARSEALVASTGAAAAAAKEDERNIVVKSPIVGTYYDSPSPGSAVFVKPGDTVEPKSVLCIIESMKLMNEIEAEIRGIVISKHQENGRPVEYGEALFTIQPL